MNRSVRLIASTLVLVACGVAYPALAQRAGQDADDKKPDARAMAKEMAQLIQQGQLNLRDATALAEQHVKGVGLEATCDIQPGLLQPERDSKRGPAAQDTDQRAAQQGKRLVYEITCFANDKIMVVHVDGLGKKVIDAKNGDKLSAAARP
jgi:hypothetical protein